MRVSIRRGPSLLYRHLLDTALPETAARLARDNRWSRREGLMIPSLAQHLRLALAQGTYRPDPPEVFEAREGGRTRRMARYGLQETLLLSALNSLLSASWAQCFLPQCIAGRKGFSRHTFIRSLNAAREARRNWILVTDVAGYYDSIYQAGLEDVLGRPPFNLPRDARSLAMDLLRAGTNGRGILPGQALAPLMANVYLHGADEFLAAQGALFCRFSDDFAVFTATKGQAERAKALRGLNRWLCWFGHQYKEGRVRRIFARLDKQVRSESRRYLKVSGQTLPSAFLEPKRFPGNLAYTTDSLRGLGLVCLSAIKEAHDHKESLKGLATRPPVALPEISEVSREADGRLRIVLRAVMSKVFPAALTVLFLTGASIQAHAQPAAVVPERLRPPADASSYAGQAVEVRGASMLPLVAPGNELWLIKGYYSDHLPQRGDLVAYRYAGNKQPLLKLAMGLPGDQWALKEEQGFYRILLNGKTLKNSSGQEYRIHQSSAKRLKLYSQTYPTIPEDAYLLLGDDPGGSLDSTAFGLVHKQDFAGRIVGMPREAAGGAISGRGRNGPLRQGNVGSGTTSPTEKLEVTAPGAGVFQVKPMPGYTSFI